MAKDEGTPRVYGAPDEEKQVPPASEGLRGEGSSPLQKGKADQTRTIDADGRKIEVTETSGQAFAESTGAASAATDEDSQA